MVFNFVMWIYLRKQSIYFHLYIIYQSLDGAGRCRHPFHKRHARPRPGLPTRVLWLTARQAAPASPSPAPAMLPHSSHWPNASLIFGFGKLGGFRGHLWCHHYHVFVEMSVTAKFATSQATTRATRNALNDPQEEILCNENRMLWVGVFQLNAQQRVVYVYLVLNEEAMSTGRMRPRRDLITTRNLWMQVSQENAHCRLTVTDTVSEMPPIAGMFFRWAAEPMI